MVFISDVRTHMGTWAHGPSVEDRHNLRMPRRKNSKSARFMSLLCPVGGVFTYAYTQEHK